MMTLERVKSFRVAGSIPSFLISKRGSVRRFLTPLPPHEPYLRISRASTATWKGVIHPSRNSGVLDLRSVILDLPLFVSGKILPIQTKSVPVIYIQTVHTSTTLSPANASATRSRCLNALIPLTGNSSSSSLSSS